ncbi:unnamed protein product [Brachionus calyciflorus]|uniref:N(6)-adenosine-methyltransferase non-catalytic subunit METTL14 n=1 Tax=Brachionus calyciflorus TaxID=104777 RepID=A0A814IDR6_9BILA|nr:unnamed protein product [Brachionus calyciflorus]
MEHLFNKTRQEHLRNSNLFKLQNLIINEYRMKMISSNNQTKANYSTTPQSSTLSFVPSSASQSNSIPKSDYIITPESSTKNSIKDFFYEYYENDIENTNKLFYKQKTSYYYNFYGILNYDWRVYYYLNDIWQNILMREFRKSYFTDLNEMCFGAYFSRKMIPNKKSLAFSCLNLIQNYQEFDNIKCIIFIDDLTKESANYQGFGVCNGKSYKMKNKTFLECFYDFYKSLKQSNKSIFENDFDGDLDNFCDLKLSSINDVNDLVLSKNDQQILIDLKKTRHIKNENNLELLKEITCSKETKIISFMEQESDSTRVLFDDEQSIKEENEGPKNDYCQHFVDTQQRPQNFIRDPGLTERFEEYPKLRELIKLKDDLISKTNAPTRPMYIKSDLISKDGGDFSLAELTGSEFDVILIEPPILEYQTNNKIFFNKFYTWDEIKSIDIASITSQRAFIFLWCGSGVGLDKGRECLKKWGFRRCEDIVWIKTNKISQTQNRNLDNGSILQRTKEHCLMGIKGTVKRSQDASFIHTNIDIDLIISEEPEEGCPNKPEEIFHIIEHFCLGRRRLYLFGRENTLRHGWLSVGPDFSQTNFDRDIFKSLFNTGNLTGTSERIELLRPRTPPIKTKMQLIQQQQQQQQQQLNNVDQINFQNNVNNVENVNTIGFNVDSNNQTTSEFDTV